MHPSSVRTLALSIALATILAAGTLFVWMISVGWIGSVANQLFSSQQPNEELTFTVEGQPLVRATTYSPNNTTVYRTLDGQTIDNLEKYELQGWQSLLPGPRMSADNSLDWHARVRGFNEASGVPNYWYWVGDGRRQAHGYFIGFDAKTKREIGYLGRGGFRTDRPPVADEFEVESRRFAHWGNFAGQYGNSAQEPYGNQSVRLPAIFLDSNQSLLKIDLRRRAVTLVPLNGKVVSVGNIGQPVRVAEEPQVIEKTRIAARLADRVVVLEDDRGQELRSIPLPEKIRDRVLAAYLTTGPEAIVVALADLHHELTEIYWLAPQGEVVRHETIRLRGGFFTSSQESPWATAVGFPSPMLCAMAFAVTRPQESVTIGRFDDFPTALAESLVESWPAFLAVLAGSAALAVSCFRRQVRYGQRGAALWAFFVLLTGPAGLVGYWLHRRWPASERCRACGKSVPRDRECCRQCATEFSRPQPRGTEIFA